jgi:nucleoside-diphosphate-sugar epimerase
MFTTTEQLEEALSRPTARDCEALAELEGDLLILGAGGKMGPSLAVRAKRAIDEAGLRKRVTAVARFSGAGLRERLSEAGIETIRADLLERDGLRALPEAPNVILMAGRKFGSQGGEHWTWATNVLLPALAAERYRHSRFVVFSSGNVYPLREIAEGGADEQTATEPVGEYAQSVRGRERVFEHYAERWGVPSVLLRLNYAVEMRYGVLADIGRKVYRRQPIDVTMGSVNVIWQGDANSVALRSFPLCSCPPERLNLTGPETLSVRALAEHFGRLFGVEPILEGAEADSALLSDAGKCGRLFGSPAAPAAEVVEWVAEWIRSGGESIEKPTHFEVRDGRF